MKSIIIFCLTLFSLSFANQSFGQDILHDIFSKMAIKASPKIEKAAIQWITNRHNFDIIPQGESATFEFQFKNTSTQAIKITNAHSSSGCVAPTWDNKAIQPNEIGTIRVVFCAKQPGTFNKIIKVYFEDTRAPESLYIEGVVRTG